MSTFMPWLLQKAEEIAPETIELRHTLHQHPELGLDLPVTGKLVEQEINRLGLEYKSGTDITAFTVRIQGQHPSKDPNTCPIVLLRGDMDALPVKEETGLSWASTNTKMHACGHDLHTAGLVGAMRLLDACKEQLAGDVVLMFQPGEEGQAGARHMIEQGMLEFDGRMPTHAYAAHVFSAFMPANTIASRPGPLFASVSDLDVTILGKGGHGSAPHQALDPVPVAAEIILQAQAMVTREFSIFDPVVISCGEIEAGDASNIIPSKVRLGFTIRTFSVETQKRARPRLAELATNIAKAHRMEVKLENQATYPVTINDADEFTYAREILQELPQMKWIEYPQPFAAGEDFSEVLNRVPGCYVGISAVEPGQDPNSLEFNHSPRALFSDYAISNCSTALASLALGRLYVE